MIKHTQTITRLLQTYCLSVFDDFVGLVLKELKSTHFLNPSRSFLLVILQAGWFPPLPKCQVPDKIELASGEPLDKW